jgi:hypothetical protein
MLAVENALWLIDGRTTTADVKGDSSIPRLLLLAIPGPMQQSQAFAAVALAGTSFHVCNWRMVHHNHHDHR